MNYNCDPIGQARVYEGVDRAVRSIRSHVQLDTEWKKDIEEDYEARKRK